MRSASPPGCGSPSSRCAAGALRSRPAVEARRGRGGPGCERTEPPPGGRGPCGTFPPPLPGTGQCSALASPADSPSLPPPGVVPRAPAGGCSFPKAGLTVSLKGWEVEVKDLKDENQENVVHLFRITQSLMKMKAQEVELALEEVEKAGEEQAKFENQLKTKVMKLENELEMAQQSAGGRDTRFLRDEIRQLEKQLEQKDRELEDLEKEMEKEKKVNEHLALRNEEAENENSKLRRENEQLRQDIIDYQKQIDSQKETLMSRRGEDSDYRLQLSKKNFELVQYLDEIQNLTEANEKIEIQNQEMRKNLEESVQEMEKMTDEYNRMKVIVQQTDTLMDQLKKERDHSRLQVQELTELLKAKNEEDDPVLAAVNAKVEEWKFVGDLDFYPLGSSSVSQLSHFVEIQTKLQNLETRNKDAERAAELAEADAREKDKELVEALKRLKDYEAGLYGLEDAVAEIKTYKSQVKIRDREIEALTTEMNKLELKINDFLDENEDLRERLGLDPKTMIDLTEFRKSKNLKQQQYKAENQVLLKEAAIMEKSQIVKPEVERLPTSKKHSGDKNDLKDDISKEHIPLQAKILKSKLESSLHTTESWHSIPPTKLSHLDPVENLIEQLRKELVFLRSQNELIFQDLLIKEAQSRDTELELQRHRSQAEQKNVYLISVKELVEEKAQLEEGLKEILQTIKEMQTEPGVKGETPLVIPSLEKLVNAMDLRNAEGVFDANLHLKAQVDQLIGRNDELRDELKETRKEATNYCQQLAKANLKVENLEKEIFLLRQAKGSNIVFKGVDLPDGMTSSSANIINSQNEYLIYILQELENKEQMLKKLEDSLEEYNRKFAVIRHQQGLLYKEYLSEKKIWQTESEKLREEKKKLEDQVEQDAIKVKEYNNLLNALQLDADETKKLLSESSRKISVLQVNEKSLIRQYTTLLEMERHLRKENSKQKNELIAMEAAVGDRIGHLQRFKEMTIFRIAALQKLIDNSVPLSELELANKQYNELTAKYRDMLQKDNMLVQRMSSLQLLECENTSLKEQIDVISKELEITKEKFHTVEQAWEQATTLGSDLTMDKAQKAITNSEIVSISKKITMLEMKELNERQRAEHSQKMYEHLRASLKQVEERNFELETKFAELTKINLAAQQLERTLRDELAESVSKEVSDADRQRILELEKSEMELKVEVSKLKEISDIAKTQVEALSSHQQSREKEVESLRMQVLDYQAQSDEKALIAKLHQHIVALQISEATSVSKLESMTSRLQKVETYNLRLEQKLDEKEQSLYFARLEGRNRAKHLRSTIQALRRQFSGALPLAQQEKFSKTMIQLQNDKLQVMQEVRTCQEERRNMENKTLELELKLKGLEELISTLKDARGAQKVIDWHMKMEELRLQELKLNRELVKDKEEMKYLKNVISEYEHTINNLEEEIVQRNKFHEEQQMSWDQREVELERQLDIFDGQQNEILSAARKFEEATGSIPDPSLPLPNQLEIALRKIKENVRIIMETRATCKSLEEKLKEKESALREAEQNVLSRDRIINELRLRLPATAERERLLAELSRKEEEPENHRALKVAHQTIANMQARLNQKEEVLKKYQHLLEKAREELMKQPSVPVATSKHFMRLAEMEQTVAEQDNSLCSLLTKMKKMSHEIDIQKQITLMKVKEFESIRAHLEENHAEVVKKLNAEIEDLKYSMSQTEKELQYFKSEVQIQKEANTRAPTATMKNLVERLKGQLALKEKQQKALSRALLELRAEMTAAAEERIILSASQKEANLNVQQIVDRHTRDLQSKPPVDNKQNVIDELQRKIKNLESQLEKCSNEAETKEKSCQEELIRWEEGKKWQAKTQGMRNKLKEKEKEIDTLTKQLNSLKELLAKSDKDKITLQKKLKSSGVTADRVMGVHASDLEKELEELRKTNIELENEIGYMRTQQALPRDSVVQDLHLQNRYLQDKLRALEEQISLKDAFSRPLQSSACDITTLSSLATQTNKNKYFVFPKKNSLLGNKKTPVTVSSVKNRKKIVGSQSFDDPHCQITGSGAQSDVALGPAGLAPSEPRECKQLNPSRQTDAEREDFTADFENEPDAEKEGLSQGCYRNGNGVHENEEEKKETAESAQGNPENMSDRRSSDPEEPARGDLENAEVNDGVNPHPEENAQTNNDTEGIRLSQMSAGEIAQSTELGLGGRSNREQLLQKENLKVSSENIELRFQLEQANKDLPRLKSGRSGKTVPELEKTIGLMKKVVEKVQKENEYLKRASGIMTSEKMSTLELENKNLKTELEKLKLHLGRQLSMQYEFNTKGPENIMVENDNLRKELKKKVESAEILRMEKNDLERSVEKLTAQLEEMSSKLYLTESRDPQLERAESRGLKSVIDMRYLKTLKVSSQSRALKNCNILGQWIAGRKKTGELIHQAGASQERIGGDSTVSGIACVLNVSLLSNFEKIKPPQTSPTSDPEKQQLKAENKKLKKELENLDPSFFEEIEDLKYNYKEEVKKNIILEEKLKQLCEQFHVELESAASVSRQLEAETDGTNNSPVC
uniref:Centrosomal protein of 290 kDa n=1 Tax=Phascolarctos cinereus TaxID=38626 RepID=A0A6P5KVA9_PHACI|nr:centrosomal protein of 290 kDa [Phascolarctos cinereus]